MTTVYGAAYSLSSNGLYRGAIQRRGTLYVPGTVQ